MRWNIFQVSLQQNPIDPVTSRPCMTYINCSMFNQVCSTKYPGLCEDCLKGEKCEKEITGTKPADEEFIPNYLLFVISKFKSYFIQ